MDIKEIRRIHNEFMEDDKSQSFNGIDTITGKSQQTDQLAKIRKLHSDFMGETKPVVGVPEEKPQISPLLSPVLAVPEIVGQLTWGMASWVPSKLTGLGQIGLQKMSNAIFKSESENLQRTPEERAQFKTGVYSPEKIRELADQAEAWWHIMPEPATKEAKVVLEKVGKGLDWLLSPFKIADEYYTKKGYPSLGYVLRFIGEGLYFKGLHGVKTTATPKLKALRKKLVKKAPINEVTDRLEGVLDEIKISKEPAAPEGDALKRVTKSQKIKAHKIQREQGLSKVEYMEIAERLTGETSIKDMNKANAGEFIKELKKGKKALRPELEPVKEIKEVKKVREIDTAESLAKEFDLRYMGESEGLEYYSMKVPDGETTLTTKGISREALVKRIEEVKEQFKIEKVKEEITEPIVEKPEEVKDAEEVRREVREAGEKERIEREEERQVRLRDAEKDRLEAEKVKEVVAEEEIKPVEEPISETAARAIADDIRTLEDMGFYAEVSEMIGEGMKVGTIMKELKQKPYYKEDMADFGYTEKDIRSAIRAAKTETGDIKAVRDIQKEIVKEEKAVERIEAEPKMSKNIKSIYNEIMSELPDYIKRDIEVESIHVGVFPVEYRGEGGRTKIIGKLKEPEKYQIFIEKGEKDIKETLRHELLHTYILKHPERLKTADGMFSHEKAVDLLEKESVGEVPLERVDPITGRPPGMERALERIEKLPDEAVERYLLSQQPLTGETGKVLKTKFAAERRAKDLSKVGELVENPKGEGWLIKESREERIRRDKAEAEQWEEILKEEEGELRPEGDRVDVDVDTFADIVKGERGAIIIHRKTVKKLKSFIRKGYYTRNRVIRELRKRGASDEDILKVFPDASIHILNEGKESKWWKRGQDPLELLSRRTRANKMKAPAITRSEAHMITTMKDLPPSLKFEGSFLGLRCFTTAGTKTHRLTAEHFSLENAIRTFEKLPPEIKETFYRTVKEGESLSHDHLQNVLKRSKKIRNSISYFRHKRIGIHAIAQQPDGIAVLAQQGITKIPKLKSKELKAYDDLRIIYDELFPLLNRARKAAGEKPFPKMENYFTWIQDLHWLEKNHGIGLFSDVRTIESKMAEIKRVPSFRYAKERAGPDRPRKLNLNPFAVMDVYAKTATHYIEMAPRLAKLNELLNERFKMAQNAPNAYNFIKHWLNYQAGKIPAWDIANPIVRRSMQILNSNIVYSLLAFNVRSTLIQPAALASSYAMLGEYYTAAGVAQVISPSKWKMAGKKSNILSTRSPDVALYEAMEASGKIPGLIQKKIGQVGLMPLTALDSVAARITWLGAYEKGLKRLKMSEKNAINYADDIVTKTQASAARSDVAPIQRTQLGKTVTCLQTFVINHWGFLTKDVMGIKNANISNPQTVKRVIRFVLATTAVNAFFEDGLHLNSPNPTPIRAYRQTFEDTEDHGKAFSSAVKEIAEYVPIWGGRLRYGSEIGGPALTETLKLIEKGDVSALTKLIGIPGSNQFFKMVKAYERGGTDLDILLGRYPELSRDWRKRVTSPAMKGPESLID